MSDLSGTIYSSAPNERDTSDVSMKDHFSLKLDNPWQILYHSLIPVWYQNIEYQVYIQFNNIISIN